MEGEFSNNGVLKTMLHLTKNEIYNFLKSRGLKEAEKNHLRNTILKIKKLNFNSNKSEPELLLAEYLVYSLSHALIKPFWFERAAVDKISMGYNYSILTTWLKNVQKLQIYLDNCVDTEEHLIIWKKLFLKLLNVFANHNLVEIKNESDGQITKHFYKFKTQLKREYNPIDFGFFLFKPYYFEYNGCLYAQGLTLLTLTPINKHNESSFKLFKLSSFDVVEKLFSKKLFLDSLILKNIKEIIIDHINTKGVSADKLEILYFSYNFYKKGQIEINEMYRYLTFFKLEAFLEFFKNGFYFSYYFDFRGRIYYRGYASPQATQIFRYCYHYGAYEDKTFPNNSALVNIETYVNYIKKSTNLTTKYPLFKNSNLDYPLFWLFIEFGKLNKNGRLSEDKWFLGWWDFIEIGVLIYNNGLATCENIEKKITFINLISILENLNAGCFNKYVIYKDATASGIQLLAAMLGPKNQEVARACNLDSNDFWYDTYSYIIHKFLKGGEMEAWIKKFFTRTYLKKTIMTFMYSATYQSLEQYFLNEIDGNGQNQIKLNFEQKHLLKKKFNIFYKFLKNFFESKEFFENSLTDIMNLLKTNLHNFKEIKIIASDGGQINLEYHKQKTYRVNVYLGGERKTMKFLKPELPIDFAQTGMALKPNTTHSLEANLTRLIILKLSYGIIVIHDCFGANIFEVDELILTTNKSINVIGLFSEYMAWKPKANYYSVFILC